MEYLPDVQSGIRNITNAFFWPYAFLGSRDQLDYIIRTKYTVKNKRSVFHISDDCFAPFSVGIAFPKRSVYGPVLNAAILRIYQSGLIAKLHSDLEWDVLRQAEDGRQSAVIGGGRKIVAAEDRSLTLADTQGMFILLGAGYILGAASLLSEWLGGCVNFCRGRTQRRSSAVLVDVPKVNSDPKENGEVVAPSQPVTHCEIVVHKPQEDIDSVDGLFHLDKLFGEPNELDQDIDIMKRSFELEDE